jgi:hypothetical protein
VPDYHGGTDRREQQHTEAEVVPTWVGAMDAHERRDRRDQGEHVPGACNPDTFTQRVADPLAKGDEKSIHVTVDTPVAERSRQMRIT